MLERHLCPDIETDKLVGWTGRYREGCGWVVGVECGRLSSVSYCVKAPAELAAQYGWYRQWRHIVIPTILLHYKYWCILSIWRRLNYCYTWNCFMFTFIVLFHIVSEANIFFLSSFSWKCNVHFVQKFFIKLENTEYFLFVKYLIHTGAYKHFIYWTLFISWITRKHAISLYTWGDVAQEVELSSGSRRVAGSIPPWACRSVPEQDT